MKTRKNQVNELLLSFSARQVNFCAQHINAYFRTKHDLLQLLLHLRLWFHEKNRNILYRNHLIFIFLKTHRRKKNVVGRLFKAFKNNFA